MSGTLLPFFVFKDPLITPFCFFLFFRGSPYYTLLPCFKDPLIAPNSRRKGTLIVKGLLRILSSSFLRFRFRSL